LLQILLEAFALSRSLCNIPHLVHAASDSDPKKSDFKENPTSMFKPAPWTYCQHAINGLRPEHAAQEMVDGYNQRCWNKYSPIAIERKKSE
jgi:hypothetical protein